MAELPVDFEKKVREASSPNGTGYPYRISARDLMQDFVFAALEASNEVHSSGLSLTEETETGQGGHIKRKIKITGELQGDGWWGTWFILDGGGNEVFTFYWEAGRLVNVTGPGNGGGTSGSGTQADPWTGGMIVAI